MAEWEPRTRAWTAKSQHEQSLERQAHALQAHGDALHRQIKHEKKLLAQVERLAAASSYEARLASREINRRHNHPRDLFLYNNNMITSVPAHGAAMMTSNTRLPFSEVWAPSIGVHTALDPAIFLGRVQAQSEVNAARIRQEQMARNRLLAHQARQNILATIVANRQSFDVSVPGMAAMPLANEVMPAYADDYSYAPTTPIIGSYDLDPVGYPMLKAEATFGIPRVGPDAISNAAYHDLAHSPLPHVTYTPHIHNILGVP